MAFPSSPTNGQQVTVNGVLYTYSTALTAWTVTSSGGALTSASSLAVTGNITGGNLVTAGQIVSSVATGTAPLAVSSTTLVTNLNADLVDGFSAQTATAANTIAVRDASQNIAAVGFNGTTVSVTGNITGGNILGGANVNATTHTGTTVSVTGNITGGNLVTAGQIVSSVATGTAPLAVSSTTLVTNLNADLWDGQHFASYLNQAVLTTSAPTFAGITSTNTINLTGTDNEILMQGITNEPASPAAAQMYFYSKNIGGRMMAKIKGPSGLDTPLQPIIGQNKIAWWNPPGNTATVPGVIGMNAPTAQGTATLRAVATTRLFTRMKRLGYVSAATAGSLCGHYETVAQYTLGDGSGLGGFYFIIRFGISDAAIQANARQFVGLTSAVAAPTDVEPSTLTNCIGVGLGTADTNLKIFYGGSAAQTPINLGANFPDTVTNTDMYELVLFAPTNANNVVHYRVTRLNTGNEASGTLTAATAGTQLPAATTLLAYRVWRATQAAAAAGIDICSVYVETDY